MDTIHDHDVKLREKKIVFLAMYDPEDFQVKSKIKNITSGINFMSQDWQMSAIDDLVDNDPEKFFQIMRVSIKDYLSQNHEESSMLNLLLLDVIKERLLQLYSAKIRCQ